MASEALFSGYFAGNAASARIQARLGFETERENMIFSAPWGRELSHVDTRLTRARYGWIQAQDHEIPRSS
jgi:RimJ/RimL family protein N-acetyltransferase